METNTMTKRIPTEKIVLWVAIASMIMMFAGLTSGYIVRKAEGNWTVFALPSVFTISTVLIVLSSLTMNMGVQAAKAGNSARLSIMLWLTLILGSGFAISQYMGWVSLVQQGVYLVGNPSGSFLYVLTGLHLAHLFGGLIALLVTAIKASNKKYDANNFLGVQLCATYWHFLDGLWVYLFLFLLLMR